MAAADDANGIPGAVEVSAKQGTCSVLGRRIRRERKN